VDSLLSEVNQHDKRLIPALYAAILGADVKRCTLSVRKDAYDSYLATVRYSFKGTTYYEADGLPCITPYEAARSLTVKLLKGASVQLDPRTSERVYSGI
jgi:hypothetical protein